MKNFIKLIAVVLFFCLVVNGKSQTNYPKIGNFQYWGYAEQKKPELTIDFVTSMSAVAEKRTGVPIISQEFAFPNFTWTQSYIRSRFVKGEQSFNQGATGLVFLMQEELAKPNRLGTWACSAGPSSADGPAYTIEGVTIPSMPGNDDAYILALLKAWDKMCTRLGAMSVMVGAAETCANDGIWTYTWGTNGVSYIAQNYDMIVIYHYPTSLAEAQGASCLQDNGESGFHDAAHYINYWRDHGFKGQIAYLLDTKFSSSGSSDLAVITADFKSAADALRNTDYIVAYPYVQQDGDRLAPARLIKLWNDYKAATTIFPDLPTNHWAYSNIMYLYDKGVISGYPNGNFGPEDNLTRAQAATMIAKAKKFSYLGGLTNFPDVPTNHWAYSYIMSCKQEGVITGYTNGNFGPDDNLTRAQAATMIAKANKFSYLGGLTNFPDVPTTHWAYSYIMSCKQEGIITGYPNGYFGPDYNVTRAEAATMIAKMMQWTAKSATEVTDTTGLTGIEPVGADNYFNLKTYPNPFSSTVTIEYSLPIAGNVSIAVYNIAGQLISTLVSEEKPAGEHSVQWSGTDSNGKELSSGMYYCRLTAGKVTRTTKLMLMKE